ncbi:Intersectin 1 (SH3 domain protein) [Homalodisca vitripennis]|nr:Intersectin 1 (SH3 domain protein) [Homalodisca vitripennis]
MWKFYTFVLLLFNNFWICNILASSGKKKIKLGKEEKKRQQHIKELIMTEQAYIDDMSIVHDVFEKPLSESKIVTPEELSTIFVNWQDIIVCNYMFLRALRVRREMSEGGVIRMIGDILCENGNLKIEKSKPMTMRRGDPQGLVLEPGLFVLFTGDLPDYLGNHCYPVSYADDTVLTHCGSLTSWAPHVAAGPNGTMSSSGRKSVTQLNDADVHIGRFSIDNGADVVIALPEPLYLDYDSDIIPATLEPCSRVIVPTSRIPQQVVVPSE